MHGTEIALGDRWEGAKTRTRSARGKPKGRSGEDDDRGEPGCVFLDTRSLSIDASSRADADRAAARMAR